MSTTATRTTRQWEHEVQAVFDLLMRGPFEGTEWELGKACGVGERIHIVLTRVRTPEWIEEYGWTIPYVVRGNYTNTWMIVDTRNLANNTVMARSQGRRAEEMLATTRRNIAQAEVALASVDGRTVAGRHWHNALLALRATAAHLDMLLEDRNGASV